MNNDGRPDLVVQTGEPTTPSTVTILLADTAGNYTVASQIHSPSLIAFPCVTADVNGDKKLDLVCAASTPGGGVATVCVYLGNGDGTFQAPISNSLGYIGASGAEFDVIAVGDFNSDGHPDLILTAGQYDYLDNFALLGDGTGHFSVNQFDGNLYWGHATVADVNGDGKLDVLLPQGPTVLIGDGNGSFTTQFDSFYGDCVFADFEKKGKYSAACGVQGSPLQFFRENADGSFNTSAPIASVSLSNTIEFPRPLAAVDLNGDGILDVVMTSASGLQVMLGKAGLTFGDPMPFTTGTPGSRYLTGTLTDMNGDKYPDFVASGPGTVYISYGNAAGSFGAPIPDETASSFTTAKAADFDGDGFADVVTVSPTGIYFRRGNGDGTFSTPVSVPLPGGISTSYDASRDNLLIGDFNGDGKKDFLIPVGMFTDNLLFLGNGDGTFAPAVVISAQTLPGSATLTSGSLIADVNKDGKDDIVQVGSTTMSAYLSQGDGTFQLVNSSFTNAASSNTGAALSDFNGDGILDAVVFFADQAIVLVGQGDGSFNSTGNSLGVPSIDGVNLITNTLPGVAVGDFDGDGKQDVALLGFYFNYATDLYTGQEGGSYTSGVWVYYGKGDATFSEPVSAGIFYDSPATTLTSATFGPGSISDLMIFGGGDIAGPENSLLAVLPANAGRTFAKPLYLAGGTAIDSLQATDFDHDGRLDLFASNASSNSFVVLINRPIVVTGALTTNPQPSLAGKSYTVTATLVPYGSQLGTINGNVSFTLDGTTIPPANLSSNIATQTVSTNLTGGDHQITAAWAGDENFAPVTFSTVQHIMDYTLTADASVSIQTGHSGSIGIHLKSIDGFADTLALQCANLPTYATCTFTNSGPNLSSGQSIDAQVTIGTTTATTAQNRVATSYAPMTLAFALPGFFLLLRRRSRIGLLVIACVIFTAAQGCGGGSGGRSGSGGGSGGGGGTQTPQSTAPGTYNISIVALSKTTQLQRTATVAVTVTP